MSLEHTVLENEEERDKEGMMKQHGNQLPAPTGQGGPACVALTFKDKRWYLQKCGMKELAVYSGMQSWKEMESYQLLRNAAVN